MNALTWIGLVVDVALLAWLIVSVKAIKGYLRRIALSLPVTPEQMKLINETISVEDAIDHTERAGGIIHVNEQNPAHSSALPYSEYLTFANTGDVEPEIIKMLRNREADVIQILRARNRANSQRSSEM